MGFGWVRLARSVGRQGFCKVALGVQSACSTHCSERRVRDTGHVVKGALGSLSDRNAPFTASETTPCQGERFWFLCGVFGSLV